MLKIYCVNSKGKNSVTGSAYNEDFVIFAPSEKEVMQIFNEIPCPAAPGWEENITVRLVGDEKSAPHLWKQREHDDSAHLIEPYKCNECSEWENELGEDFVCEECQEELDSECNEYYD